MVVKEAPSSAFQFQSFWDPCASAQPEVTILHLGGCLNFCITLFCVSLWRNQDPAPSPHYFLTASPFFFFLQSLTPLISNCLHLLFETRTWKDLCPGGPHRILFSLNLTFVIFCDCFILFCTLFLKISCLLYFWWHWVFVAACRLSLVVVSGSYSSSQCMGFSLRGLLLLWRTGSRLMGLSSCSSWALECGFSSCGARAELLRAV